MSEPWSEITLDDLPLREDLRGIEPYEAAQPEAAVRLHLNENPHAPSAKVVTDIAAAVAEAASGLNRYPDQHFIRLRAELGAYLTADGGISIGAEHVWAANGSNEVLQQLLLAFGGVGRTALSFAPTYSMYPEYARNSQTNWIVGQRRDDFTLDIEHARAMIVEHHPSVVILTSPNNPTGTALLLADVEAVLEVAPGVVVVDEAYGEFRRAGVPSALSLLPTFPKLIVTRTMSKAFAFAGGRLGYFAASRAIIDAVQLVRLPYHVSSITAAIARAALAHSSELLAKVGELRDERDATVHWLREIGLNAADSDSNFVLFGTFDDRHVIWQGLVQRGVLIRETGPDHWLRVSIGTAEEMAAFRRALHEVLSLEGIPTQD
jgi:histidinol-phosphate aminotransferase